MYPYINPCITFTELYNFFGALECKTHLFLSFILKYKGRLTAALNCCPSFRFFLCLLSGVGNYFQLCLSGSTDVCNIFHLLFIISFHIRASFEKVLSSWCVCVFLAVLGWIYAVLFFFFFCLLKENPFSFYRPTVPHSLNAQTYLTGKQCFFACSLIPKTNFLINFYDTVWKKKVDFFFFSGSEMQQLLCIHV